MHLDAIEVALANGSIQRGRGDSEAVLSLIHQAVAAEGHWQTLEIGGREYVLIATPFC
jgi:hypothetical protein